MRAATLTQPWTAPVWVALAWLIAVPLFAIKARYLPALPVVMRDAWSVAPDLVAGFRRTLTETILGFLLGAAGGLGAGVVFASFRWIERAVFPLVVAIQTIPVIAFGAIVVIWFGNTILAKVVIAFFLTFFPVAVNTLRGLQAQDPQRLALLRSFGASPAVVLRLLTLPTAAPDIMVGLKLGVSLSLAGAIVGEWFGDTVGLGVMLLQALYFEQVPRIWVLVIATGLLGAVLYAALAAVEKRLIWWRSP